MTFTDLAKSYVRTIVPLLVGGIVAWALHHGHDISGYEGLVTVLVTAGYYGAARLLEHYVSPQFGWLLGSASAPTYPAPAAVPAKVAAPAKDAGLTLIEAVVIATLILVVLLVLGAVPR